MRGAGAHYWVTPDGITKEYVETVPAAQGGLSISPAGSNASPTFEHRGHVVRVRIEGAEGRSMSYGSHPVETREHYMTGPLDQWRNHCRTFQTVVTENIRPGVSARYYPDGGTLRYDLIVGAGIDPSTVVMRYEGAENLRIAVDGSLMYDTSVGPKREAGLYTYQWIEGRRAPVDAKFTVDGDRVRISVGDYDRNYPVVIDPQYLTYASYLSRAITLNATSMDLFPNGELLTSGWTQFNGFPTTPGAFQSSRLGTNSVVLTVWRGNIIRFATYLGSNEMTGGGNSNAFVHAGEQVTLAMSTTNAGSIDLPASTAMNTGGPTGPIFLQNDGADPTGTPTSTDVYIAKLKPDLSQIRYATFLAGGSNELPRGVQIRSSGRILVYGETFSNDMPVTVGGPSGTYSGHWDGFIAEFGPTLNQRIQCVYLGTPEGEGLSSIALRRDGAVYVAGSTSGTTLLSRYGVATPFQSTAISSGDGFVMLLAPNLIPQIGTYLATAQPDRVYRIAWSGNQLILGGNSGAFPFGTAPFPPIAAIGGFDRVNTNGDSFIARMSSDLSTMRHFTYIGGTDSENLNAMTVLEDGTIVAAGNTRSATAPFDGSFTQTSFAVTSDAFIASSSMRPFVVSLSPSLGLKNATRIGGGSGTFGTAVDMHGVGPLGDVFVLVSLSGDSWTSTSAPNLASYSTSPTGGAIARIAYSADPTDLRLSSTTLPPDKDTIFGNILTNAARTWNKSYQLVSSDSRFQVLNPTVIVAAGQRQSAQFQVRRNGVFSGPTDVTLSIREGTSTLLTRTVTVMP